MVHVEFLLYFLELSRGMLHRDCVLAAVIVVSLTVVDVREAQLW